MTIRQYNATLQPHGISLSTVLAHSLVPVLSAAPVFLYYSYGIEAQTLIYLSSILLLAVLGWGILSWRSATGRLFDPYVLFLIAAVLFNGGHAFLEIFHLNEAGIMHNVFSADTTFLTLTLVILGLSAFHFGALFSTLADSKKRSRRDSSILSTGPTGRELRYVGWGLFIISFLPVVFLLKESIATVMSFGYFALYQRDSVTGFNAAPRVLATFIVPASIFLLAGSEKQRGLVRFSALIIFAYSFSQFFLGARSWAVMPLIAYAWTWHRCIRPIRRTLLIGSSSVMIFIVFPLIGMVRSVTGADRLSWSFMANALFSMDNPAIASLSEMGSSMNTVAYTLELVPFIRDYDMGISYLYALLTVMPNLFWDIHPTVAHGLAGDWLTWIVDPAFAGRGGSLGFSFIAEAYLNFGWVGSLIFLAIIGFLFGKLVLWADSGYDSARLTVVAVFLAFFLLYSRGESSYIIRPLIWYALMPYLCAYALRTVNLKAHSMSDDYKDRQTKTVMREA